MPLESLEARVPSTHIKDTPGIAIIIVTLASRASLKTSIESALASANRVSLEIILVCPISRVIILRGLLIKNFSSADREKIKIIPEEGPGVYEAMNLGLRNSNMSHVLFLNDDDRLLPNSIDRIFADELENWPDLIAGVTYLEFSCCGLWHPTFPEDLLGSRIEEGGMSTSHQSQIWRRNLMLELGGFRRTLNSRFPILGSLRKIHIACDFDFFVRAVENGISYSSHQIVLSIVDAHGESGIAWRKTYWNLNKVIWSTYKPSWLWFGKFVRNIISAEVFHRNSTWVHDH